MRSGALIQGFCEILEFHFGQPVWGSFDFAVITYFFLDLVGRLEEVVKFSTTFFSARVLGQEPPMSDSKPFLLGYRVDRKIGRYRGTSFRCLRLAMDVLNLKRCCPTVSDEFIRRSMRKHAQAICGPPRDVSNLPEGVLAEVRRFFDDQCKNFGAPEPLKLELPSSAASFEFSRSSGGPESLLYNHPFDLGSEEVEKFLSELDVPLQPIGRMGLSARHEWSMTVNDLYKSSTGVSLLEEGGKTALFERLAEYDLSIPKGLLSAVRLEALRGGFQPIKAQAVPICEPCKVRVITKGETLPYLALKSFQVSVSRWIAKSYNFCLTRSSFGESDVATFLQRSAEFYGTDADLLVVSADYSAATDNLRSDLSVSIALEFMNFFGQSFVDLLIRGLVGHEVFYFRDYFDELPEGFLYEDSSITESDWQNRHQKDSPCYKKIPRVHAKQQNGQLMGSYASFVVLCIANFSVIASVLREVNPESKARHLPILINGDDALFCVPRNGGWLEKWKDLTTSCGLALSPGKNYVLPWSPASSKPSMLMINSKCFQITGLSVRHVPYINGGLLRGWTKLSAEFWTLLSAESGIASRFNQLIAGFAGFEAWKLALKFIRWWSWALRDPGIIPDSVPWYLPEVYGGLGFKPIEICGVACQPGRSNRPLEVRAAYGLFCEYRGSQVQVTRHSEVEVGERRLCRTNFATVHRNGVSPDGLRHWRELTRRFKTESSPLCQKSAVVQDRFDQINSRGGYQFIFSSEPLTCDDMPLGWTELEQVNPLLCAMVPVLYDDPVEDIRHVFTVTKDRPLVGSKSFEWRHRLFLQGVAKWGKLMKRFVHFKLPKSLTADEVSKFLWTRQFAKPVVRGNTASDYSGDNLHLFLFPGSLEFNERKWDLQDLAPCIDRSGAPLRSGRHQTPVQLTYHSMKNKSCTAHSLTEVKVPEGINHSLLPPSLVRTDEAGYDFSEERKLWHQPADGWMEAIPSAGQGVLTPDSVAMLNGP